MSPWKSVCVGLISILKGLNKKEMTHSLNDVIIYLSHFLVNFFLY